MDMFSWIWKIIIKLFIIIIFLSTIFFMYCYIFLYVFHQDFVNFCGYTLFEVGSGSMSPTIKSNDVVVVKINDNYNETDIITFLYKDNYVTHRVIQINHDSLVTKGDANNVVDDTIDKNQVVGRVIFILHNVGIWRKVLFSPRVLITFVISLVLLIFTVSYDNNLYKTFRKRRISKKKIREMKKEIRNNKKSDKSRKKKLLAKKNVRRNSHDK